VAVTSSSSTLADDTQASQTFTLSATQTVLAIYVANSNYGSTNDYHGIQNAINVDGTNVSLMNDSTVNSNYAIRNSCIWVGTLGSGQHTITGKLASITNGQTTTINNRTLLIYIFNGDSFSYIDNTTSQASSSTTYVDDSYATSTFTPSGNCVALSLYAATNTIGATEAPYGGKICLNVDGSDYSIYESGKSPYYSNYSNSAITIYSKNLNAVSTTIKGRYASANTGTVTVSRSVLAILLFDPSTILDFSPNAIQASSTSTSLVNDPGISITRAISGELLLLANSYKKQGTTASAYGMAYGINLDSSDVAVSRNSPYVTSSGESVFVAYGTTLSSGSHTINGRFAVNSSTTAAKVDERILIALWFAQSPAGHGYGSDYAYITSQNSNNVSVINRSINTVSNQIALGNNSYAVAVTPDGKKAYITGNTSSNLQIINTQTNSISSTLSIASSYGVAVSPDGTKVYVCSSSSNIISVIYTSTDTVSTTITVGSGPYGVAFSPTETKAYVCNNTTGSISVINTSNDTVSGTISSITGARYICFTPDGSKAYVVLSGGTVKVITTSNNTVTTTINVGSNPWGVAVSPDGSMVYVANIGGNSVSVIATSTDTVSTTITVDTGPRAICFSPDGAFAYVTNNGAGTVSVINTSTNTVSTTITVGSQPNAVGKFIRPTLVPTASYTPSATTGDTSTSFTFTDTTTGTPTSWDWDFGDGTAHSYAQNPTHTYASAGTYTVRLISFNVAGYSVDTQTGQITVSADGPTTLALTSSISGGGTLTANASLLTKGLLTYNSKYVVQSTTAVTSSSSTLADDTQASQTFTLTATQTILAFYIANSVQGDTNPDTGFSSAINVDGTDYCQMYDTPAGSGYAIRNSTFFVGSLAAGSHTIKGRLATNTGTSTITVSSRTLIVMVLNGDQAYYSYDNTHTVTSSSTTYADDGYATFTHTPLGTCNALILYAASNAYNDSESIFGKKICINIGSSDYTACEVQKSPTSTNYADSICTAYALSGVSGSLTATGRYATASQYAITVSRRAFAMLFFDPAVIIDLSSSITQVTSTSTTLADDSQALISRTTSGYLLALVSEEHKNASTGSYYGTGYGLMIDGSDVAQSRSSMYPSTYSESNFVAYSQDLATSKSWVVKGRIASNSGTNQATVDSRCLMAIWFPPGTTSSIVLTSSISGGGTPSASIIEYEQISSSLTGGGIPSTTIKELIQIGSTVSGSGALTASGSLNSAITSSISGGGSESATLIVVTYSPINSTISGGGSITATIKEFEMVGSTISGGGSQSASVIEITTLPVASSISGGGTFTATIIEFIQILSSIIASASETANIIEYEQLTSTISGNGTESANATVINGSVNVSSSISGGGSITAAITEFEQIASSISGGGTVTSNASINKLITSSLTGGGSLTATILVYDYINSTAAGAGGMTANPLVYEMIVSTISGAGSETANATVLTGAVNCTSSVSGGGSESANSVVYNYINSMVAGSGSETATICVLRPVTSSISGLGDQTAQAFLNKIISSIITGSGDQTANPLTYNCLSSNIAGMGLESANALVYEYISSAIAGHGTTTSNPAVWEMISSSIEGIGDSAATPHIITIIIKTLNYPLSITLNTVTRTVTFQPVIRSVVLDY
jgi:YVTN family beta-propeller protein